MVAVEQDDNNNIDNLNFNTLSHDMVRQYLMTQQQQLNENSKSNEQPESKKRFHSFSVESLLKSTSVQDNAVSSLPFTGFVPNYPLLDPTSMTSINNTLASIPYFNSLFQPNPALFAAQSNTFAAAAAAAAASLPKPQSDSSDIISSLASSYNSSSTLNQPLHTLNHPLNINNSFNSKYLLDFFVL